MALVGGLGASGDERGRETEEGEGMQRVRERREGTRGVVVARIRTKGGLQREAGGGRGSRARATPRLCLLAEEDDERQGRWAGPRWRSWARQVSQVSGWASLFFNFSSVLFYLIVTEFKFKQI